MVDEREITLQWIEQVLRNPVFEESDPRHPGAVRAYAPIAAFGNRMLRVVYYDRGTGTAGNHTFLRSPGYGKGTDAMRMMWDKQADALYIRFDEAKIVESEEVSDGIILDFDASGRVVGFEMLDVQQRFPDADLSRVDVEMA